MPLSTLQFHGDETPTQCAELSAIAGHRPWLRALRIRDNDSTQEIQRLSLEYLNAGAQAILFDTFSQQAYGGTGHRFDWSILPEEIASRCILSGGLNSDNVRMAINTVQPYAVDVSSGVESHPGVKDPERIVAFIKAVRSPTAPELS